jgi:hypothetical protein
MTKELNETRKGAMLLMTAMQGTAVILMERINSRKYF